MNTHHILLSPLFMLVSTLLGAAGGAAIAALRTRSAVMRAQAHYLRQLDKIYRRGPDSTAATPQSTCEPQAASDASDSPVPIGEKPRAPEASATNIRAPEAGFEASIITAPEVAIALAPFGAAHARASLASLSAALEYVRARLHAVRYSMDSTDCHALAWLLHAVGDLAAAIDGDPQWNTDVTRSHLAKLDIAVSPGSWWQTSQRPRETEAYDPEPLPKPSLPALLDVYESVVARELRTLSAWVRGISDRGTQAHARWKRERAPGATADRVLAAVAPPSGATVTTTRKATRRTAVRDGK